MESTRPAGVRGSTRRRPATEKNWRKKLARVPLTSQSPEPIPQASDERACTAGRAATEPRPKEGRDAEHVAGPGRDTGRLRLSPARLVRTSISVRTYVHTRVMADGRDAYRIRVSDRRPGARASCCRGQCEGARLPIFRQAEAMVPLTATRLDASGGRRVLAAATAGDRSLANIASE